MTVYGKVGKQKYRFPTFPQTLEIAPTISTFPPHRLRLLTYPNSKQKGPSLVRLTFAPFRLILQLEKTGLFLTFGGEHFPYCYGLSRGGYVGFFLRKKPAERVPSVYTYTGNTLTSTVEITGLSFPQGYGSPVFPLFRAKTLRFPSLWVALSGVPSYGDVV
jgi:hypothetical protein